MKTKFLLLLLAAAMIVVAPLSPGSAQDYDDPGYDSDEYSDSEYDNELEPILVTAAEYGSLETFLELLKQAGLADELKKDGPFTVFAPDDSAFALVQPEELEKLLSNQKALKAILSRHIVTGRRVEFGDKAETLTIEPLSGDKIKVEITEESVQVGQAWVIDEQIECSNGVIHVIDAVLLPSKGQQKD